MCCPLSTRDVNIRAHKPCTPRQRSLRTGDSIGQCSPHKKTCELWLILCQLTAISGAEKLFQDSASRTNQCNLKMELVSSTVVAFVLTCLQPPMTVAKPQPKGHARSAPPGLHGKPSLTSRIHLAENPGPPTRTPDLPGVARGLGLGQKRDKYRRPALCQEKREHFCSCGEGGEISVVEVDMCKGLSRWGSRLCEPCEKASEICMRLRHCARCQQNNPRAVCSACPPDRYGPRCEYERPCKTPVTPEDLTMHVTVEKGDVQTLQFDCSTKEKVLQGAKTVKCDQHKGKWDHDLPTCVSPCPKLALQGGQVSYRHVAADVSASSVAGGTVAEVSCEEGLVLQGVPVLTCSPLNGTWLPDVPKCERQCDVRQQGKACDVSVGATSHIVVDNNVTEILPGQTVKYRCEDGYFPHRGGTAEPVCLYNGTLAGRPFLCGRPYTILCNIDISNQKYLKFCRGNGCNGSDTFWPDAQYEIPTDVISAFGHVGFSCQFGQLRGSTSMQCMPDSSGKGKLVGQLPTCDIPCGVRLPRKTARLRGGTPTNAIQEWPWQAALYHYQAPNGHKRAEFLCGAALVALQWALTAAHCVTQDKTTQLFPVEQLRLTYGFHNSNDSKAAVEKSDNRKYEVERVLVYRDYDPNRLNHDIALLKLREPLELSHEVGVVCLPESLACSDQRLDNGPLGYVTGWGLPDYGDDLSHELRELQLKVAKNDDCNQVYRDEGYNEGEVFTTSMLCAVSSTPHQDIDSGDSGGPFVVLGRDRYVLEGVVSWSKRSDPHQEQTHNRSFLPSRSSHRFRQRALGEQEADDSQPLCTGNGTCMSGHTRVARYIQWIGREIGLSTGAGCL